MRGGKPGIPGLDQVGMLRGEEMAASLCYDPPHVCVHVQRGRAGVGKRAEAGGGAQDRAGLRRCLLGPLGSNSSHRSGTQDLLRVHRLDPLDKGV